MAKASFFFFPNLQPPDILRALNQFHVMGVKNKWSVVDFEPWLAKNKAKRWTELFFFFYSFSWITWVLLVLVPLKLYESFGEWGYLGIGIGASAPCIVLPLLFEGKTDAKKPFSQKYWVKANVWIAVFSFVGNYVWTHYFYDILGASYTFPAHRLND